MHGYTSQYVSKYPTINSNVSGLQDYADYNMYNIWVPCTALVDVAGTGLISTRGDVPIKIYADAVTTASAYAFRKPKHWSNGVVTARVHYSGDYVAGTNVDASLRVSTFRENDAIALGTFGIVSMPTPSAVGAYMICSLFEDLDLTTSNACLLVREPDRLVTVCFRRRGAAGGDTYTSDLELFGLEVFYREYKHTSYTKAAGINWTS